jgi:predicted dehydrogenase
MGKRRVRLLARNFGGVGVAGADTSESRREEAEASFGIDTYPSLDKALNGHFDCAFVCSGPLSHGKIIEKCLSAGLHVFSELNLVSDGYRENLKLAEDRNKTLFMSSTFLYRDDVRHIIDAARKAKPPLFYTYHVGQYLPDWHPWESFKDFFVGEKRTGGCREIMAIEFPWLTRAFGEVAAASTHGASMSSLGLPYPDAYWLRLEHKGGAVGQMTVDLVSRVPVRHFEVFGEEFQLEWRGKPEELWTARADYSSMEKVELRKAPQRQEGYRDFIVEDAYLEEMRAFFAAMRGESQPVYTFHDDLRTIETIDGILGAEF